ncbi:MAG: hypothetical protein J2P36_19270 [Ktedonobacteraceae bacterium]|nr:hypothetical protein [Ktedonobacteraceae bacterium]
MEQNISPVKRQRRLKMYGSSSSRRANEDLERFLDVRDGLYRHVSPFAELRQMAVNDPFD